MLSYQVFTENLGGSWTDLQGKITKSIDDKMKLPKKILHNIHIKLYKYNEKKRLTQNKRCEYCGNKYKTTIHHCKYCTDSCRIKAEQDNNKKECNDTGENIPSHNLVQATYHPHHKKTRLWKKK